MIIEYSVIKLRSALVGVPRVYFRRITENISKTTKNIFMVNEEIIKIMYL